MQFSVAEIERLIKKGNFSIEEEISVNILNFIHTIHNNRLDFINEFFDSKYFGDLGMTFRKDSGQVMGLITATYNGVTKRYIFNDKGYELLDDLLELE